MTEPEKDPTAGLKLITVIWVVLGLVMVLVLALGIIEKETFQWVFPSGFLLYTLIALGMKQRA